MQLKIKQVPIKKESSIMKSIKINLSKSDEDLFGQSKWWGQADMPDDLEYPLIPYDDDYDDDHMTLVCQIFLI